jgi:Bacterial regulatory proteins, tetR family
LHTRIPGSRTWPIDRKKPKKTCLSEAIARHRRYPCRSDRSRFDQRRFRPGEHNRIAATAGVSIGSLYQYFPSKEALVAAVIERHAQELLQVVRETFLTVASRPIDIAVRELVAAGINAHRVDPKLHRVLDEEVPRTGRFENLDAL